MDVITVSLSVCGITSPVSFFHLSYLLEELSFCVI